jgi:hypothetical protein
VSWKRHHHYLTLVTDHEAKKIVWGAEGKDTATLDAFFDQLGSERAAGIETVSMVAGQRARLVELRRRGYWPAQVPAVVLTEALTGDHRRDFHANRLLRTCQIRDVDEPQAREGARLHTCTGRAGTISATDAIVVAFASTWADPVVFTSDPHDLDTLAEHTARPITVATV